MNSSLVRKETRFLTEGNWLPVPTVTGAQRAPSFDEPIIFGSDRLPDPTDPLSVTVKIEPEHYGQMSQALARINQLASLDEGWDSYGARAVQPDSAIHAVRLLAAVISAGAPLPEIVPTTEGGIQLEWHRSGADLELEITPRSAVEVFLRFPDEQTWEGPLANNKWRLEQFLAIISDSGDDHPDG